MAEVLVDASRNPAELTCITRPSGVEGHDFENDVCRSVPAVVTWHALGTSFHGY
jgi:hypothetical protein